MSREDSSRHCRYFPALLGMIGGRRADPKINALCGHLTFERLPELQPFDPKRDASIRQRLGDDPEAVSPAHHVRRDAPPAIVFFGTDDRLLEGAQYMQKHMKAEGNRCELLTWEGLPHGFFNWGRYDNKPFWETMRAADKFLASLGYIEGNPTIEDYQP